MSGCAGPVEVKVGQVWQRRRTRRKWTKTLTFKVLELVDFNHKGERAPSARCHVVETGATAVVEIQNMKPGKFQGYSLMRQSPDEASP